MTQELEITTADGTAKAWFHRPEGNGPFPGVLFVMDALGYRPSVRAMSERLSKLGFAVLAPNLFYRAGDFQPFDPKTVFTDTKERERLGGIMKHLTPPLAMSDFAAYFDTLGSQPGVDKARLGATGYCMGGRLCFIASATMPERLKAVMCFHAGNIVNDEPDSPHLAAAKIKAKLYFGVPVDDRSFTPDQHGKLAVALSTAKVGHTMELYPGAMHGFAVDDMPVYNRDASEKHWLRMESFFRENL
jgi:carboxymethylenebutenolidase